MSPEAQRIAIAEACGWKNFFTHKWLPEYTREGYVYCEIGGIAPDGEPARLPDYCDDLNAMHEAEKVLNGREQWEEYWHTLDGITGYMQPGWVAGCATAAQRAEAFLRTIGKWEDSK